MTKQHEALTTFYDPITRACVTNHMNEHILLTKSGQSVKLKGNN